MNQLPRMALALVILSVLATGVSFLADEDDELVLTKQEEQQLTQWENHPDPLLAKLAKSVKKKVKKIKKEVKEEVKKFGDKTQESLKDFDKEIKSIRSKIKLKQKHEPKGIARPTILAQGFFDITSTSATLKFLFSMPVTLALLGDQPQSDNTFSEQKTMPLSGLTPNTLYNLTLIATTKYGQTLEITIPLQTLP